MQLVTEKISVDDLKKMSEKMFGGFVKAVVDIQKGVMVVDAELHADQESFLLEHDSQQEHLWGINFYPERYGNADWIEFDSMINLRPSWGNKSRGVNDSKIQAKIRVIADKLVTP
ncbi:MAG: DUF5674 family protein [Candidatus Babeliales bacterium]